MSILLETNLPLPLFRRGKVRDAYDLGNRLLIVSTDRISAFDVVLPCGIPDKGKVLNQLSAFWFENTRHILPNHFHEVIDSDVVASLPSVIARAESPKQSQRGRDSSLTLGTSLVGRSMIVAKAERILARLSKSELESLFDYTYYTRHVDSIFERLGLK